MPNARRWTSKKELPEGTILWERLQILEKFLLYEGNNTKEQPEGSIRSKQPESPKEIRNRASLLEANLGPSWGQLGPNMGKHGPSWAYLEAKLGLTWTQHGPT